MSNDGDDIWEGEFSYYKEPKPLKDFEIKIKEHEEAINQAELLLRDIQDDKLSNQKALISYNDIAYHNEKIAFIKDVHLEHFI